MAELSAVSHHAPRRLSRWLWFSALFAALAFCLWPSWKAGDAPSVGPSPLQQARLDAQSLAAGQKLPTAPIETLRCGLRVLGTNPEIAPDELPPEPSPKTDRLIRLRMVRPSGKPLDVALIRPLGSVRQGAHNCFWVCPWRWQEGFPFSPRGEAAKFSQFSRLP